MDAKLIQLKTDFNNIISIRTTVKNIFDILQVRIDKLKDLYAEFIKTKAVNKGKIIEIETFGNPMLSVGDIVSVKYAYQNLQETQKMIITNVSQSFMEGISTSITCRTL
jgi:cystathionine beta-lyase/cystathionine gamma-synthase